MVNWTDPSGKNRNGLDLPAPTTVDECQDLIHEMQSVLYLFEAGDDSLADADQDNITELIDIMRAVDPQDVGRQALPRLWQSAIQMWLFTDAILDALRLNLRTDNQEFQDQVEHLKGVAKEYQAKLFEKYQELEEKNGKGN